MRFITNPQTLTIKFQGMEIIWGLKSKIVLDRAEIESLEWKPGPLDPQSFKGWRCPGTSIPGVFLAGSFAHLGKWQFWCVHLKRPGEIVITTNKKRYHVIRVSADDAVANAVLSWWNSR